MKMALGWADHLANHGEERGERRWRLNCFGGRWGSMGDVIGLFGRVEIGRNQVIGCDVNALMKALFLLHVVSYKAI
jgi:hypothetical protein